MSSRSLIASRALHMRRPALPAPWMELSCWEGAEYNSEQLVHRGRQAAATVAPHMKLPKSGVPCLQAGRGNSFLFFV